MERNQEVMVALSESVMKIRLAKKLSVHVISFIT